MTEITGKKIEFESGQDLTIQTIINNLEIRYQFLKGRFDCATGEAKRSNDESYLNGYGYQYELEAKKDARTDEF